MDGFGSQRVNGADTTLRQPLWWKFIAVAVAAVLAVSLTPLPGNSGRSYASDVLQGEQGGVDAAGQFTAASLAEAGDGETASAPTGNFASVRLNETSYTYDGYAKTPEATVVSTDGVTLVPGVNYTVRYSDNVNAGKAVATVIGLGRFSGQTETASFVIEPARIRSIAKIAPQTYRKGMQVRPPVAVNTNGIAPEAGVDYKVRYKKNRSIGTAKVIVTGRGNYTGTKSRSFKILPRKSRIRSIVSEQPGQVTVSYVRRMRQERGYQIALSTSKKMKSLKTVTVNSKLTGTKTIWNLEPGKTYYVRIRTFAKVGSLRWYSKWSDIKSVAVLENAPEPSDPPEPAKPSASQATESVSSAPQ